MQEAKLLISFCVIGGCISLCSIAYWYAMSSVPVKLVHSHVSLFMVFNAKAWQKNASIIFCACVCNIRAYIDFNHVPVQHQTVVQS